MAYTVPRVEITQEFVAAPTFSSNPLSAFIFGPNYKLLRHTEAAEKGQTLIGDYVAAGISLTTYPWVVSFPDARVDLTLGSDGLPANITPYLENAFVLYYAWDFTVQGSHSSGDPQVNAVDTGVFAGVSATTKYYTNWIQAPVLNFADGVNPTTGAPLPRSIFFANRDVQVGDWVKISGTNNADGSVNFFTKIVEVKTNPNTGRVNVLRVADRIWDTASGSVSTLLGPAHTNSRIQLFLRKSVEMPKSFLLNTTSTTQVGAIAVGTNSGSIPVHAQVTDPLLVDEDGVPKPLLLSVPSFIAGSLPIGKLYVSYRVLRTDNATQISSLSDLSAVETVLGAVTPQNPLAEGVYDAILNASGTDVYFMAVPTNDVAGYQAVLEQAKRSSVLYGFVPLTFDATVQTAVKAHVAAMSTPAQAKWRKAWLCLDPVTEAILPGYTRAAGGVNWIVGDFLFVDPETTVDNTYWTIVPASGSYTADLMTGGVRAGDFIRFFSDSTTTSSYVDVEITEVRSQNTLVTGVTAGISDGNAIQIVRHYTNDEQIAALAAVTDNDRRVNLVFPAHVKTAGVAKDGYYVAAALAGLRAGSLPHRPLTNVELLGFDDFTDTLVTFTPTQLDTLAASGYWIMLQDTVGGTPYVRHQLTTAGYNEVGDDPKFSEDSITTNVDSVSYGLQRALSPYIGKYNVNPATLALVTDAVNRQLRQHMLSSAQSAPGPQLLGYTIKSIGKSTIFKDRIEASIELDLPFPLNKVTISLVVP